ncbi:alpha/beta fold hydrolase [Leptospira barantonii]|uniref:Alpha/beta fold hydrolase n=1 Tax=Leptospira barantonii TaxID=2023184 RepID=A0A5F2BNF3_9LEPT|nr:alpha/beta fold hydrolase [Leptospira barantonii]TGM07032.1 alpha/beta fold hydrolase [Leptospira barantonii]
MKNFNSHPRSFFKGRIFSTTSHLVVFFFVSCSSLFYQPNQERYWKPDALGFSYTEEIFITPEGETLKLWRIGPKNSKPKGVILQFHGNGENRTSHFTSLVWLVNHGYQLVAFDYRGYLDSSGVAEREGIHKDSVALIIRELEYSKIQNIPLIVYGQSLGGAIAARAVPEIGDKSGLLLVVLDGSFSSYRQVFKSVLRNIFFTPIDSIFGIFMDDSLSPEETIGMISPVPLLVIHGTEDAVVHYENGMNLFKLAKEPKWFWEVRGGGHVNWMALGNSKESKNFLIFLDSLIRNFNP